MKIESYLKGRAYILIVSSHFESTLEMGAAEMIAPNNQFTYF
jgi:hypothetical protein